VSDKGGFTPLFVACQNAYVDVARLLLDHKASEDLANNNGATPLYMACFNGHVDVARLLLDHKASVDLAMKDGSTPLYYTLLINNRHAGCGLKKYTFGYSTSTGIRGGWGALDSTGDRAQGSGRVHLPSVRAGVARSWAGS